MSQTEMFESKSKDRINSMIDIETCVACKKIWLFIMYAENQKPELIHL